MPQPGAPLAGPAPADRLWLQASDRQERLETDPAAGVDVACSLMEDLATSGAFDGVHLVPVGRYRSVASRLENAGWTARR